jgi:hypothetical protein
LNLITGLSSEKTLGKLKHSFYGGLEGHTAENGMTDHTGSIVFITGEELFCLIVRFGVIPLILLILSKGIARHSFHANRDRY